MPNALILNISNPLDRAEFLREVEGLARARERRNERERDSVVILAHCPELRRRSIHEHLPLRDDHGAGTDRLDLLENVRAEHDGPPRVCIAPAGQFTDHGPDFVLLVRIEPVGRFVEDQHRRLVQHRLRQTDAPLESLRECFDRLSHHSADVHALHHRVDPPAFFRAREPADLRDEVKKCTRSHVGVIGRSFRQVSDHALHSHRVVHDISAAHHRRSAGRRQKAGHHFHRGRFSCAVRT